MATIEQPETTLFHNAAYEGPSEGGAVASGSMPSGQSAGLPSENSSGFTPAQEHWLVNTMSRLLQPSNPIRAAERSPLRERDYNRRDRDADFVPQIRNLKDWNSDDIYAWPVWFDSAQTTCRNQNVPQHREYDAVQHAITGYARRLLAQLPVHERPRTLRDLERFVQGRILTETHRMKAFNELDRISFRTHGEKAESVAQAFRENLALLPSQETNSMYVLNKFAKAFPEQITKHLVSLPAGTTFEEYARAAVEKEVALERAHNNDSWKHEFGHLVNSYNKQTAPARRNIADAMPGFNAIAHDSICTEDHLCDLDREFNAMGGYVSGGKDFKSKPKGGRPSEFNNCRFCQKPGHFWRDCPEITKPENADAAKEFARLWAQLQTASRALSNFVAHQ